MIGDEPAVLLDFLGAASRVMDLGGASEVMVSSSTRGLIEDGGLRFESRGVRSLKGLPTPIEVFVLADDPER